MSSPNLRLPFLLAVVFLLSGCADAPPPVPPLVEKIDAVLKRPEYKNARWGILVVDEAGKTVYEHNADQLFAPASVTKLYSCGAALVEFGADYRFETPVFARGKITDGKLAGDLILVAKGDLTLGGRTDRDGKMAFTDDDHIYASPTGTTTAVTDTDPLAGLTELARQVKAAGVRQITGDVLIDDRMFEHARGSGSGPGIVTPILVNDNIVDVIVSPAEKAGAPATYRLRPETPFMQIDVQVETIDKGKPTRVQTQPAGPRSWTVRGQVPIGGKPVVRICTVNDPAGFARALFIDCLRREGIEVKASVLRAPSAELPEADSYQKLKRVALFRSLPLSEAIKVTLKVSHNLYASTLPLLLAVKHGQRTQPEGMRLEGKVLAKLGVDIKSISLESGAGGGNGDKVTPRATVQLLQAMRKRDDWARYEEGLPILGTDGTLAAISKDSPARGKVRGKTGTYTDANLLLGRPYLRAKSLAGVMTTAKGQTLLFTLFVNDVPLAAGVAPLREGRMIGQLSEIIQQNAP
jgi:D-alanyl-D-alanine carboxypeptidase/D-alanyl-D-alanine-endopeptidase (penicillin-binding protein 4)